MPAQTVPAETVPAQTVPSIAPIDDSIRQRIVGVSWHEGCPVDLEDLRYVTVRHVDAQGADAVGELMVHADAADDMVTVFERLYEARFPIESVRLVDDFGADDQTSMRANNSSAFNCRFVARTQRWSQHAYGRAIDINPLVNPYVRATSVSPPQGAPFVDRSLDHPGLIRAGDVVVEAFAAVGWGWGGDWPSGPDYQHFSASGS